jgi:hypothetical protein
MDEQQFDKDIRNILENSPPFEVTEQAVTDMNARINQAYGLRRWWIPWWWWVPLLVLPFAVGTTYFFVKFQNLNKKLDEINLRLSLNQNDTITHNYIVYHYDTVYSKVSLTEGGEQRFKAQNSWPSYRSQGENSWTGQHPFTTTIPSFYPDNPEGNAVNYRLLDQIESGKVTLTDLKRTLDFIEEVNDIDTRSWTNLIAISRSRTPYLPTTNFIKEKALLSFSPIHFSIGHAKRLRTPLVEGIQLGGFFGLATLTEYSNSPVWEANVDLLFSRKLKMRTGFQQIAIDFEEKEEDHFDQYPLVQPDNPGDELEEIKVNYALARVPLRIIYTFASRKSIRPYIGIGFSGIKAIRPKLKYEFSGSAGEYYKMQTFDIPSISINNFEFGVGLEFYLGKGINASLEGYRFQNFDKNLEQINRLSHLGGKVGLHYSF